MIGTYIRDENTKLKYRIEEVKRLQGRYNSPDGSTILVNEQIVVLKSLHHVQNLKGNHIKINGASIPLSQMTWLNQLEYSLTFFKKLLKQKRLKKIDY